MYPRSVKDSDSSTFFSESAKKLFMGLLLFLIETGYEGKSVVTLFSLFPLTVRRTGVPLVEWVL